MYKKAFTFNDITLADIPSNIIPTDACITANVTRDIQIKKPIISAAMDTVTEAEMAVAMAKNGCLGVLHRNLTIEEQVKQLMWVRRQVHNGGKIERPITFLDTDTVADLQHSIRISNWRFTSFPIVDITGILVGMVTKDELSFVDATNPTLKEIMKPIDHLVTAPESTDPDTAFGIMIEKRVKKLPLVDIDGKLLGMYVWADVRRDKETRSEFSLDRDGRLLVAGAVGPTDYKRVDALITAGCQILVIDCSHGACKSVLDILSYIRKNNVAVIAGNIASYDSARYLLESETPPDALKVGIGPGTICTTRRVTGHGVPQVTAISEVRRACKDLQMSIPIIADGGITCSGDIVKALAGGANCVMLGGMLAGTDESPGDIITRDNKKYKNYRGMGSRAAMSERSGSRDRYFKGANIDRTGERVTVQQAQKITPEGIEAVVEYKGPVGVILEELCGGVCSGMAHSNARTIGELQTNAVIWEQTMSGYVEGNPHNVIV